MCTFNLKTNSNIMEIQQVHFFHIYFVDFFIPLLIIMKSLEEKCKM